MKPILQKTLLLLLLLLLLSWLVYLSSIGTITAPLLTKATAHAVCGIQHLFGSECTVTGSKILYPGFSLLITLLCTGIDMLLFCAILLFIYYGFKDMRRTQEILLFLVGILLLNLFRLLLFSPLVTAFGFEKAAWLYTISYEHLQGAVLLLLTAGFIIWRDFHDRATGDGRGRGKARASGRGKAKKKRVRRPRSSRTSSR